MCLYPTLIKNKKYTETVKNGGKVPPVIDQRTLYVPIGCGDCIECRNKKAREWQIRLMEEIKTNKNGKFIALTFSNEAIFKLGENTENLKELERIKEIKGYERDNRIAITAVRLFLERWRKKYGKSLRHWFITELGHQGTENIHIHGIVWTNENRDTIEAIWKYGKIWPRTAKEEKGSYVNNKTINYIIKYVTKQDVDHKYYKPRIMTTPGIGANYKNTWNATQNAYNGTNTNQTYTTSTGHKVQLPIYWRNAIYNENQRENLWIQTLDKQERWIMGNKIDISQNNKEYTATLKHYQKVNRILGYGNGQRKWDEMKYQNQLRNLRYEERIQKLKEEWIQLQKTRG